MFEPRLLLSIFCEFRFRQKKLCTKVGANKMGIALGEENMKEKDMGTKERNDRDEARQRAFQCFGTARILEKRQKTIEFYLFINKVIELIIPAGIGFVAITFRKAQSNMDTLLTLVGIFGLIQLTFSLFVLIKKWESKRESYIDSISKNLAYFKSFEKIRKRYDQGREYKELLKEMILLDDELQEKDEKMCISEKEKLYGRKLAFERLGREFSDCHKNQEGEHSKCEK